MKEQGRRAALGIAEALGHRVVSLNLRPMPHVRFEPVSLPLSFTLDLDLLDRQREPMERVC